MGTDKSEIVKIITAIKVQCPKAMPYKSAAEFEAIVDMWYVAFKNYPKAVVWEATGNALKNTVYQEQNWLGAVNKEIEALELAVKDTDGELWAELTAALRETGRLMYFGTSQHWYNGELINPMEKVGEIYNNLSPILKEYVGDIPELVTLSKTETLEYEKGRFQRTIPTLRQRDKTRREMSPMLAGLIQSAGGENQKLLKGG